MADIAERVQGVFHKVFNDPGILIRRETTAYDISDWDSLAHLQIILGVQKEFGIELTAAEALKAANVGELLDLIEIKLKGNARR